jgi:2,3,4,5-tetrahydropyridine-2-carboxylate N-succinyltransferase
VNGWLIKALMLADLIHDCDLHEGGPGGMSWWDKESCKFRSWTEADFRAAGVRTLPGSVVRYSAFIGPRAVILPSFVSWGRGSRRAR